MSRPYISIVIPAYNESACLANCLRSLQRQDSARTYEIIVVDNASTDDTVQIATAHDVRVISEPRKGVCSARQAGLTAARGDIIVSSDADCTYPAGWLRQIERSFCTQPDLALLIGTYRFGRGQLFNRLLSAWEQLTIRLHYGFGWQLYVSAANLAFRKRLFDGYNADLQSGGDELYVVSWLRRKGRVAFDTTNAVITSDRRLYNRFLTALLKDFGLKYLGYYFGKRFRQTRPSAVADIRQQPPSQQLVKFIMVTIGLLGLLLLFYLAGWSVVWFGVIIFSRPERIIGTLALLSGLAAYVIFWPSSQLMLPSPWRARTGQKLIALTFDDGPNEPFTSQIATIIESYGGLASFFQCGRLIEHSPASTRRLAAAGHTIGNHTYDHSFWTLWRPKKLLAGITQTSRLITNATGQPVHFLRLPWLAKTPAACRVIHRTGLLPMAGQFLSFREVLQPDGRVMADRALKKIRPGSILIMHDSRETHGGIRAQTVEAVRIVCAELSARGYRFVSLDELYSVRESRPD